MINLEISDGKLEELYKRIKPVVLENNELHYIKDIDLRTRSFIWSPEIIDRAENLEPLATINTYHTYGYYGLFKPSIAEVLAQIPNEYINDCVVFKVDSEGLDVNNIFDDRYHVTKTILYKIKN